MQIYLVQRGRTSLEPPDWRPERFIKFSSDRWSYAGTRHFFYVDRSLVAAMRFQTTQTSLKTGCVMECQVEIRMPHTRTHWFVCVLLLTLLFFFAAGC